MTNKYRAGKELLLADGLSRLPNPRSKQEIDLDIVVCLVQFSTEKIRLLQRETSNDAVLCNLREVIVEGWPDERDNIPKPLRRYWCYRDELSVEDGLITKGDRVVIPQSVQSEVLERLHAGHQGIEKYKLRAKSCIYWDGINKDLEDMAKRCPTCLELRKSNEKETLMLQEVPTRAWAHILFTSTTTST